MAKPLIWPYSRLSGNLPSPVNPLPDLVSMRMAGSRGRVPAVNKLFFPDGEESLRRGKDRFGVRWVARRIASDEPPNCSPILL